MIRSVSLNEVGADVKKTSTDFGISIRNMEYIIRNMTVWIPCQERSFLTSQYHKLLNNQDNLS